MANFGEAIEAAKQGKLIAREGWNGKGMFVFMRPADELSVHFIVNSVKSLPQSFKDYQSKMVFNADTYDTINENTVKIKFGAYLCLSTPNNDVINGWNASTSDVLAEDWVILD